MARGRAADGPDCSRRRSPPGSSRAIRRSTCRRRRCRSCRSKKPIASRPTRNAFQVQVSGNDVNIYNFAMAHLRTLAGIESATPQQINPGGTSYILVTYNGDIAQLAAALAARGWVVEVPGPWSRSVRRRTSRRRCRRRRCSRSPSRRTQPQPQRRQRRPGRSNEAGAGPDRASARLAAKRGRCPIHRLRRQSRGIRAFPQVEHVAGQGDDPDRAAAVGPDAACAQLRRAGRRAAVRRSRTARRGGAVPRLEPGAGHAAGRWS